MSKQTVESHARIDAHFWATEPIRRFASALAQHFADAWPRLHAGEPVRRTGLVPMRWTRGPQKTVIASLQWGVGQAEGDQVCRLLLFPALLDLPKTAPQEVSLDWHTSAGEEATSPVLLCPFCGQRCRYLYQATKTQKRRPNQQSSLGRGARAGEFACRLCAGLCYAGQLTSRSRSGLSACLRSLSNDLLRSRSLSEEAVTEAQEALLKIVQFQQKCAERMQRIEKEKSLEGETAAQDPTIQDPAIKNPVQAEVQTAVLEQPDPQKQGAHPPISDTGKRPAGRPKERRRYNGEARKEVSCAGQLAPDEGYCVGCRARRQLIQAAPFLASNGRPGIKGQCAECGRGLCRLGSFENSAS